MRFFPRAIAVCRGLLAAILSVLILAPTPASFASAYNAHPKLVVVIVIDQFRGDYLERYRDQFGEGGFRLLLDHGANFTDCNFDYANTRTAPGHATLFTGAYSNGHGIAANEWWDSKKKKMVTSVEDDDTKLVGMPADQLKEIKRKTKPARRRTTCSPIRSVTNSSSQPTVSRECLESR